MGVGVWFELVVLGIATPVIVECVLSFAASCLQYCGIGATEMVVFVTDTNGCHNSIKWITKDAAVMFPLLFS